MAIKKYDNIFNDIEKEKIKEEYLNGASIREIAEKYNIKSKSWVQYKLLKGISRTQSESATLAHKKYPEHFLHSDETKDKIRKKRIKYMQEHPESTAWRKRNTPSYPEQCFIKFLQENGYDKMYLIEREKSIFPFFIDFAFIYNKIAVEIDGSQHVSNMERIQRDFEKDSLLLQNGWRVLRISENLIKTDWETIKTKLDELLSEQPNEMSVQKIGIFKATKSRKKVERDKNGLTKKMKDGFYNQRKVKERPSLETLEMLHKTLSLVKIAKKYHVSETTIRKWIKQYKKYI